MRRFKCVSKGILAVCLSMAIGASAAFAAYPTKPITVTQGFKAGGGSDTVAQLTQPYLDPGRDRSHRVDAACEDRKERRLYAQHHEHPDASDQLHNEQRDQIHDRRA